MDFYKKLATHTIYQVIARIASSGASFLITIFIARHFGVIQYGDFAKVTAYVTMFYLLADFGLNAIFLQREDNHVHFRELFYSRLILSLGLIVLANAIAFLLPYNPVSGIGFSPFVRLSIFVFSLTIFTESILFSTFAIFQRNILYHRFMAATIIGSLATILFVFLFGLSGFSLIFIFVGFLAGAIVEAVSMLLLTKEKILPPWIDLSFTKRLFLETLPVTAMLVFNLLYFRIDTLLLAGMKPSTDVAFYDISYRVFDFLIALPLFLSNVLYPKLLDHEKKSRKLKRKYAEYILVFAGIGIAIVVPMWEIGPIVFAIIKPSLLGASVPFHLLLLSLPLFFITSIVQWILLAKRQQLFLACVYGGLTIVNIVLNLMYIPQYSFIASAIITGVCEAGVAAILLVKVFAERE